MTTLTHRHKFKTLSKYRERCVMPLSCLEIMIHRRSSCIVLEGMYIPMWLWRTISYYSAINQHPESLYSPHVVLERPGHSITSTTQRPLHNRTLKACTTPRVALERILGARTLWSPLNSTLRTCID